MWNFYVALGIMMIGSIVIVVDTLEEVHKNMHIHELTHTHDGTTHTHIIEHNHKHAHFKDEDEHMHHHNEKELLKELKHNSIQT